MLFKSIVAEVDLRNIFSYLVLRSSQISHISSLCFASKP